MLIQCILVSLLCLRVSYAGGPTLVLVDNNATKETHSVFFKSLQDRGYQLTFKSADDSSLSLVKYGQHLYDHLILFSPLVEEFGGTLSVPAITNFIDNGGNVLVTAGSSVGDAIRELAPENGLEIDKDGNYIVDDTNYDKTLDDGTHTTIIADSKNLVNAATIVGDKKNVGNLLFKGAGILSTTNNPLVLNVLKPSPNAFSHNPKSTAKGEAVGPQTSLIAALQARNNARILICGSLDFFSDKFFRAIDKSTNKKYGNEQLSKSLTEWVFKENGVLRVGAVKHHKVGETNPPEAYTIMEDVVYSIEIEILKNGKWVPYEAKDIQLEFIRIDPFVRMPLTQQGNRYVAKFKIPDVYGVYKFVVDYKRMGYTYLYSSTQVSVRPLEHTQYERFIRSAYPYYVSAFSMMFGLILFSCVFLYHKDETKDKAE